MNFDATPGGPNATSYLTVEEANDYFGGRLHSENWNDLTPKETALMTATRVLDQYVEWQGTKTTESQALDWPRAGVIDKDGYSVDEHIIPVAIKEATCELAYYMLAGDRLADNPLKGFSRIKVDTLELESDKYAFPEVLPDSIWAVIGVFGNRPMEMAQVRLVRC